MKKILKVLLVLAGVYCLLLIPLPQKDGALQKPSQAPFVWDQDALWEQLEASFLSGKAMPAATLDSLVNHMAMESDSLLLAHADKRIPPEDGFYPALIERRFFQIAPLIAAQENKSDWHVRFYNRVRKKIKLDSRFWDMNSSSARNTSYRILYGMRATVEEILLQSSDDQFVSTTFVSDEPSATPSVDILGIEVHSGDLLVSRGGAEVSAFISRGNDFPGNFSPVALVHISKRLMSPI